MLKYMLQDLAKVQLILRLSNIVNSTRCKLYSSSDDMELSELFDIIETELRNGLVDIDDDGKNDGILQFIMVSM